MSEIEKMYENAGIEPTYTDECHMADSYYSMAKDLNERGILFDDYMKQECPNKNEVCYETCPYAYNKEFYPPFTAEKQLKLIELFISSIWWENLKILYKTLDCSLNFEDKLAKLVNYLWLSLSEEEKQQVKGILE